MSAVQNTQDEDYPISPAKRLVHQTKFQDPGPVPESGGPGDEAGVGQARALILMSYWATPEASTGVTPNLMMLGRQTQLPVQAMYRTPLGPDEEKRTVSEYVTALQKGLRAAYRHALEGLQRTGSFVSGSKGRFGERRDRPRRPQGRGSGSLDSSGSTFFVITLFFLFFHLFIKFSVFREGVCRGTCGGHTPTAPLLVNLGWSNEDPVL